MFQKSVFLKTIAFISISLSLQGMKVSDLLNEKRNQRTEEKRTSKRPLNYYLFKWELKKNIPSSDEVKANIEQESAAKKQKTEKNIPHNNQLIHIYPSTSESYCRYASIIEHLKKIESRNKVFYCKYCDIPFLSEVLFASHSYYKHNQPFKINHDNIQGNHNEQSSK